MEKYKFDENNGLWYELQGDYYLPCLKLPEKEQPHIGIWGQRHLRYLKKHHRVYTSPNFLRMDILCFLRHFNLYFFSAPRPTISISPFSCIWRASRYARVFLTFRSSCRSSSVISPYSAK